MMSGLNMFAEEVGWRIMKRAERQCYSDSAAILIDPASSRAPVRRVAGRLREQGGRFKGGYSAQTEKEEEGENRRR